MKKYTFVPGGWDAGDFMYVGTAREDYRSAFVQQADHVCSPFDEKRGEYDFVSSVTREKLSSGAVLDTVCAFEGSGAPLIVLSGDISTLPDGSLLYGTHFEVVVYKGGMNIWRIDLIEGKAKSRPVIKCAFPLEENVPVRLRVQINKDAFDVIAGEYSFHVPCEELPESFHAGITACEGVCRFYELTIE